MTNRNKTWIAKQATTRWARLLKSSLLAVAVLAAPSVSLAQYTYVPTTGQSGNWNQALGARWTGGPALTFPNAAGATATFNLPASIAPDGNYNVQLGQNITVGSITVNHSVLAPGTLRIGANGTGTLTFSSTSGPATYTENPGVPDNTFRTDIFAPVVFASDTVITQNHNLDNNRSTLFTFSGNSAGGITAAPEITLTKEGQGNIAFEVPPTSPTTGFRGSVVVNNGGIRLEENVFANAAAVTVASGGQLQLGAGAVVPNWNIGPGGVLTLNGQGKTVGANPEGALRYQNVQNSANFNNPVLLASDSGIYVNSGTPTQQGNLTLTDVVSGDGGINKIGGGILTLANANTYIGTTVVDEGVLRAVNATGSATGTGPVVVNAGGTLDGTGTIAGSVSFVGGTFSPGTSAGTLNLGSTTFDALSTLNYELATPNVVGGVNDLANVAGDLTLAGVLNVTQLPGFGLGTYRLFNYTGQLVDNGLALNVGLLPEGWLASIDTSLANEVNLTIGLVPEPGAFALVALGGVILVGVRAIRGRKSARSA